MTWNREEAEKRRKAYWAKKKRREFREMFWFFTGIVLTGVGCIWLLTIPYLP